MDLEQQLHSLLEETKQSARTLQGSDREILRIAVLGRKGKLAHLFDELTKLSGDERKRVGQFANRVRSDLVALLEEKKASSRFTTSEELAKAITWSNHSDHIQGKLHPITRIIQRVASVFLSMGFEIVDSPELETEEYNFDLLNIPEDVPARDESDTFFVQKSKGHTDAILRTQTSPMQIRAMKERKPPVRILAPGRVFRHEATDASHESNFYQCEGFVIDKNISMAHLKTTLQTVLQELYGKNVKIRLRPHYYPFVEPGMDVDMFYKRPGDDEPRWLEILGSGMIHPTVLRNMGVDPSVYSGFAFAFGIDRVAMLYWDIPDIRMLYSGNMKFLHSL